jgi:tyrosinase
MGNEEFSLFILAMQQWQLASTSTVGGYYQVAGIHGAPHQYWDNDGGFQNTGQGNKDGGYCFHGTKDFYLWVGLTGWCLSAISMMQMG